MCETPTTLKFQRRNLPHWVVADRTYFITIRLAGTLPRYVVEELMEEREELRRRRASDSERWEVSRGQFIRIERILDACGREEQPLAGQVAVPGEVQPVASTGCSSNRPPRRDWLTRRGVPENLLSSLAWLENTDHGWDVYAAVVMSNHMHLILRNLNGRTAELLADLSQYKRHTAREANRILGRTGTFWAREDFDHWCRTPEKTAAAVRYVAENPPKAGLCLHWRDWPWTKIKTEWIGIAGLQVQPVVFNWLLG